MTIAHGDTDVAAPKLHVSTQKSSGKESSFVITNVAGRSGNLDDGLPVQLGALWKTLKKFGNTLFDFYSACIQLRS